MVNKVFIWIIGSGYLERPELEEVMNNVAGDLGVEVT